MRLTAVTSMESQAKAGEEKIADKCRSQLMEIYKEIESESLNVVNIYLKLFV